MPLTPKQQDAENKRKAYLLATIAAKQEALKAPEEALKAPASDDEEAGEESDSVEGKLESIAHPEHTADDLTDCLNENEIRTNDKQFDILHNVVREAMAAAYKGIPFDADGELINAAKHAGLRLAADQMDSLKDLIQVYTNVVDEYKGESYEDAEEKKHAWRPSCDCPSCQAAYAKENERRRKAGLSHESTQITNFIKAVSQKNYASANKYLQGVVEGKLKRTISKVVNK